MKIIALLPFRNEEKFLPSYLSNVSPIVDEIIAIDDRSTDNSAKILKLAKAKVYDNNETVKSGWPELGIREKLLRLGRENGGTHFVVLDADETFTGNFLKVSRQVLERLEPGQRVLMQWLAMWKSVDHYRDDSSVWSNNFKDFIFCDDGKSSYPNIWMHTPRTPGDFATAQNSLTLNPKYGTVAHFQFSDWDHFQIKQCWLRCSELIKKPNTWLETNQKYNITLDDPNALVRALPKEWAMGIKFPHVEYEQSIKLNWRLEQIKQWFDEYGPGFFEKLDIWHVDEIRKFRDKQ